MEATEDHHVKRNKPSHKEKYHMLFSHLNLGEAKKKHMMVK
jgi:hypothetical protein